MDEKTFVPGVLHSRMSMFLLGATLALGFTFSAYLIGKAAVRVTQPNHIFVKGSAVKTVRSDFGIWSGSITIRAANIADGYKALAADQQKIAEFLKKQGFSEKEFVLESIQISENYRRDAKGNRTSVIDDYILSRRVTVSSSKVDQLERVVREFTSLAGKGLLVRSFPAKFVITDLDKYKMQLLKEASRNAVERAKVMAGNSNGKVGSLLSARQGVFQITAPASGESSDIGEYDKSTILKEIKAVVTLQFKVE